MTKLNVIYMMTSKWQTVPVMKDMVGMVQIVLVRLPRTTNLCSNLYITHLPCNSFRSMRGSELSSKCDL